MGVVAGRGLVVGEAVGDCVIIFGASVITAVDWQALTSDATNISTAIIFPSSFDIVFSFLFLGFHCIELPIQRAKIDNPVLHNRRRNHTHKILIRHQYGI